MTKTTRKFVTKQTRSGKSYTLQMKQEIEDVESLLRHREDSQGKCSPIRSRGVKILKKLVNKTKSKAPSMMSLPLNKR